MEVQINYIAVILAMLSSLVVGSIWYAQSVFGKEWAKLAKVKIKTDTASMLKPIGVTVVVSLITAFVLAYMTYISNQFLQNSFLQDALMTSLWLWVGFTAARFITHDAFEGRPEKLTILNLGNEFVTIMLMGLIIGLFGV
jgi:hypothetical protein